MCVQEFDLDCVAYVEDTSTVAAEEDWRGWWGDCELGVAYVAVHVSGLGPDA